jgi:hypothetical protein
MNIQKKILPLYVVDIAYKQSPNSTIAKSPKYISLLHKKSQTTNRTNINTWPDWLKMVDTLRRRAATPRVVPSARPKMRGTRDLLSLWWITRTSRSWQRLAHKQRRNRMIVNEASFSAVSKPHARRSRLWKQSSILGTVESNTLLTEWRIGGWVFYI